MEAVSWEQQAGAAQRPILICAFKGWNDAAESATGALEFLAAQWDAERGSARSIPTSSSISRSPGRRSA